MVLYTNNPIDAGQSPALQQSSPILALAELERHAAGLPSLAPITRRSLGVQA